MTGTGGLPHRRRRRAAARGQAGYDQADDLTVYSVGRIPKEGYASFAKETNLKAIRIGVVREFMDKGLFTQADHESIDIIDRAIEDLRKLGATIVDPGAGGALFQKCIDQHIPRNLNVLFTRQFPLQFRAEADHISVLEDMYIDPSLVPAKLTIRDFGKTADATEKASITSTDIYASAATRTSGSSPI
jgi:hypothetical protein